MTVTTADVTFLLSIFGAELIVAAAIFLFIVLTHERIGTENKSQSVNLPIVEVDLGQQQQQQQQESGMTSVASEAAFVKNDCRVVGFPLTDIRAFTLKPFNPYCDLALISSNQCRALVLHSNSSSTFSGLLPFYNSCRIVGFSLNDPRNLTSTTTDNDCRALALTSGNNANADNDCHALTLTYNNEDNSKRSISSGKNKINHIQKNIDAVAKMSARSAGTTKPKKKSLSSMFVMSTSDAMLRSTYQPKITVGKAPHFLTEERSSARLLHSSNCCQVASRTARTQSNIGLITY